VSPGRAVLPPPTVAELLTLPLHVLVRDWPEVGAPLVAAGLDLGEAGARSLSELEPPAGGSSGEGGAPGSALSRWEGLVGELSALTAWRLSVG